MANLYSKWSDKNVTKKSNTCVFELQLSSENYGRLNMKTVHNIHNIFLVLANYAVL